MKGLEAYTGSQWRIIVHDEARHFDLRDEAIAAAEKEVMDGGGIESLDVEHLENGLHGVQWYRAETVTRETILTKLLDAATDAREAYETALSAIERFLGADSDELGMDDEEMLGTSAGELLALATE